MSHTITIIRDGVPYVGTPEDLRALFQSEAPAKAPVSEEPTFMTTVHDKRLARRESTVLGGLTSAERKFISAQWYLTHTERYTAEEWATLVTAYKAATK